MRDLLYLNNLKAVFQVAYENIRFSTLFAAGDVSFLRAKRPSGSDPSVIRAKSGRERATERSQRISLGDVTAHGRVQE